MSRTAVPRMIHAEPISTHDGDGNLSKPRGVPPWRNPDRSPAPHTTPQPVPAYTPRPTSQRQHQSTRSPTSPTGDRGVKTIDTHTNMQVPCLSCVSAEPPPQADASTSAPTRGGEHRGRPAPRPHPTRPLRHPSASRGEPTKTPTGRHEGNHAYTGQAQIRTPVCQPHRALPRTPRGTPTPHQGCSTCSTKATTRKGGANRSTPAFLTMSSRTHFAHQHDSHGTHEPTS